MMRVACLAFASLLIGCTFDASGKGSETGSTSETEGSGSGESSGGEAGTGDSGSGSSTTDASSSTTDASSSTTDASSSTTDTTDGTDTDPTTGTDTDPTTGTDTDPTTGTDTEPTTGTDTDPTTGTDTDPTTGPTSDSQATDTSATTGAQDCGEQPEDGPYAQCFETSQCFGADHCVALTGNGGIIDGHCTNFCEFDDQCPVPAGCDVQARCQPLESLNGGAACLLDCTQSQECPIGMECIEVNLNYDICM